MSRDLGATHPTFLCTARMTSTLTANAAVIRPWG
jgi:hypothetical protein